MTNIYGRKGASSIPAEITADSNGGFTAVASDGERDRDGEILAPGCFNPLPKSVPVHLDHVMTARGVIGRAKPYYLRDKLMVDVTFASTPDAQEVRQKVLDGVLDSLSIVFQAGKWQTGDHGVRTLVAGELLATDIVSVPANPRALIVASRSLGLTSRQTRDLIHEASADALLALARADVADGRRALDRLGPPAKRYYNPLTQRWHDPKEWR